MEILVIITVRIRIITTTTTIIAATDENNDNHINLKK